MSPVELLANLLFAEAYKSRSKADWDKMVNDATSIAWVVKNRLLRPNRFGKTLEEVILAPNQFSGVGSEEWNKAANKKFTSDEEKIYKQLLAISGGVLKGSIPDPTKGADHYYNPEFASPAWGKLTTPDNVENWTYYYMPTTKSFKHLFFRETLKKPRLRVRKARRKR